MSLTVESGSEFVDIEGAEDEEARGKDKEGEALSPGERMRSD